MQKYIEATIQTIRNQVLPNRTNIICIEGIDTPVIYKSICAYFHSYSNGSFVAKLTKDKYNQFLMDGQMAWQNSLAFLMENDYVDNDGAMTKWRNKAADAGGNETSLVLLMGTELAPDKGGLQDFYHISPNDIIRSLSRDYSTWFKDIFKACDLNSDERKAIHTLFRVIFHDINIDLIKLSTFIDGLSELRFDTTQELINYICENMNIVWGIPQISSIKAVPKVSNLCKGKLNDCKIVSDAYAFINRKGGILSPSQLNKTRKQLSKYIEKHAIDPNIPFPTETGQFENFNFFSECLVDFLCGKNVDENRKRFLELDYGIISQIMGTKLESTTAKNSVTAVSGEPIKAFIEMLSTSFKRHFEEYNRMPEKAVIKISEIRLSNCTSDDNNTPVDDGDTLDVAYNNMCCFLGGIVDYLNKSGIESGEGNSVEICYDGDFDPFVSQNYLMAKNHTTIGVTKKFNDLCRVELFIKLVDDVQEDKHEFKWVFTPKSAWKNCFALLNKLVNNNTEFFDSPTILICDNISEYMKCESEEEFFTKLEQIKETNWHNEHMEKIHRYFRGNNVIVYYDDLLDAFGEWVDLLCKRGLFNSLDILGNIITKYDTLMQYVNSNVASFTSAQFESLHMLLNTFLIVGNRRVLDTGDVQETIVPAYHPIMLEKIEAKMEFLRQGLKELVSDIMGKRGTTLNVNAKINKLVELSSIILATDIILSNARNYLMCQNVWNYFGVYFDESASNAIVPSGTYGIVIDEDDEDRRGMLVATPESNIISRNLMDFIKTFPARVDGLNVCFIAPKDLQHIVAAMQSIARKIESAEISALINVKIICLDNQKNSASYLRYWLDNYFGEERLVRVNTYLKYLSVDGASVDSIDNCLKNQDVCFVYNILTPTQIRFKKSDQEQPEYTQFKFPMTFAPDTISQTQGRRNVNVSQCQFPASKSYTQVVHAIGNANDEKGIYKVMRVLEMKDVQERIINNAHKHCKWVVCIDQAIDRYILQNDYRKIIGFTTGEGCYGELNVTVSARQDILTDIKAMLKRRIIEKFKNWESDRLERSAEFCVDITKNLDGSRILKALNPYDYEIHNYLAYVLTLQMLHISENDSRYLIRNLINLDSHRHWFTNEFEDKIDDNSKRPDFILIEILNDEANTTVGKNLKIKITVIECKMGMINPSQIDNAKRQLEQGIKVLSRNWGTSNSSITKRYWYNQLYRSIIFSPLNLEDNRQEYAVVSDKIFNILDGNFEVEWGAKIFAFWLNENRADVEEFELDLNFDDTVTNLTTIQCYIAGQQFIQKMLVPVYERNQEFAFNVIDANETLVEDDILDNDATSSENNNIVSGDSGSYIMHSGNHDNAIDDDSVDDQTGVDNTLLNASGNSDSDEKVADPVQAGGRNQDLESQDTNTIVDVSSVRLLLGEDLRTKEKYFWEFGNQQLQNRHILILGNSGSGKTYCIQSLLLELSRQQISSVIFDYTAGFARNHLNPFFVEQIGNKLKQQIVYLDKFPINPFNKLTEDIDGRIIEETDSKVATRLAGILKKVYGLGEQQYSCVYKAIKSALQQHGSITSFHHMITELENMEVNTAKSVINKISPFIDAEIFDYQGEMNWNDIIEQRGIVYVIQLQGYDDEIKKVVTELILWDIWNYSVKNGNEKNPLPLILDEAQNLDFGEKSPTAKILHEGRKFGVSAWFATQFLGGRFKDDEINRLLQVDQRLYFMPAASEIPSVSKSIDNNSANAREWQQRLQRLNKGECVTCGSMVRNGKWGKYDPRIIKITGLEDRVARE